MGLTIIHPSGSTSTFTKPINRDLPLTEIADAMRNHDPSLGHFFIPEIVKGLDEEGRLVLLVCEDAAHPKGRAPNPVASAYYDRLAKLNGFHPNPGRPSMAGVVMLVTTPDRIAEYPHYPGRQIDQPPEAAERSRRAINAHADAAIAVLGLPGIAERDAPKPADIPGGGQLVVALEQMTELGVWETVDYAGPFNDRAVADLYGTEWARRKNEEQGVFTHTDAYDEEEYEAEPGHYSHAVEPMRDPTRGAP